MPGTTVSTLYSLPCLSFTTILPADKTQFPLCRWRDKANAKGHRVSKVWNTAACVAPSSRAWTIDDALSAPSFHLWKVVTKHSPGPFHTIILWAGVHKANGDMQYISYKAEKEASYIHSYTSFRKINEISFAHFNSSIFLSIVYSKIIY